MASFIVSICTTHRYRMEADSERDAMRSAGELLDGGFVMNCETLDNGPTGIEVVREAEE